MSEKSYSYEQAGVSIAAGNALVKAIGPLAKATARPGADAELGGFGGFFDLKAAGYTDPLLVAANDGVGTKVKLAIDHDRHDAIGIDLVAMCVNDLIVQGAEPLLFLDYFASAKLDNGIATRVVSTPCWELFAAQPAAYRESVLAKNTVRVAVEAAASFGWERFIGEDGVFVGMNGFGASAPADRLYKEFGITAEAVAAAAKSKL